MKEKTSFMLIMLIVIASCRRKEEPKQAATEYCSCMIENNTNNDYVVASAICKGEMLKKYHLYKVFYRYMHDEAYSKQLPEKTLDSAKIFMLTFLETSNKLDCGSQKLNNTKKKNN